MVTLTKKQLWKENDEWVVVGSKREKPELGWVVVPSDKSKPAPTDEPVYFAIGQHSVEDAVRPADKWPKATRVHVLWQRSLHA